MTFDPLGIGTAATMFLIAGVLGAYMMFGSPPKKTKDALMWGVLLFGAVGLVTSGWLVATPEPDSVAPPEVADFNVSVTESLSHVVSSEPYHYTCQMNYNQTSAAFVSSTQYCNLSVTVSRSDVDSDPAFTSVSVKSIGTYSSTTATWSERDIVARNTDGTYQITFVDSNSGSHNISPGTTATIPRLDTMRTDTGTIQIVADGITPDGMSQYDSSYVVLTVGGQDITVGFELVTIAT